ncbi:MAG TPA: helix-turn-helix transcriptional regulator [Candidatus Fimivicinus intestinavium]|nr:helix-turn-helix transcriptional regulator [Candidatus Fimivicinus intestinavium]
MENHIAALRKERRLSQEELAQAVGVSRQTITSLEVGKYTASLPLAFRLARYFGCAIEDLFIFEEE